MKKDYLTIIYMASGSSHARGPNLKDCVERVQRIFVSDWSSLFDVKGKAVKVACYDVTGHDDLYWDHRGVFATKPGTDDETKVPLMELQDVTLPTK